MAPLDEIKDLLELLVAELNTLEYKTDSIKLLDRDAQELIEQLNDPFIVWGENADTHLHKQLLKLRNRLKKVSLVKLPKSTDRIRSLLIQLIGETDVPPTYEGRLDYHHNQEDDQESPSRTSGLIKQLSVRQDELRGEILQSIQKIDERTGEAERYIGRIEKVATQKLRQEASELGELHTDQLKQQFDESVKEIQSSSNSVLVRLNLELKKATEELVEKHQADYDSLYAELSSQTLEQIKNSDEARSEFDRKIRDLNRVFDEHVIELNERFSKEQVEYKASLLQSIKDEVSRYQTVKSLLKTQLDEAKEIVGILSKNAMAHEHLKQAQHEAYAYWGFQSAGLLFLFFAILMSVAIFGDSLGLRLPWLSWLVEFSSSSGAIQIQGIPADNANLAAQSTTSEASWFFKRISIVLLLTAPGLYLLKEAANHRTKENLYRQRGIQLASITPYLKELEESERNAIKKDLVKSFFSFHDGKADTQNVPDFLRDLKETTKIIRSIDRATQPTSNKRSIVKRRRRQPQTTGV